MKKYIALGAALVVLGIVFYQSSPFTKLETDSTGLSLPPLTFAPENLSLELPGVSGPSEGREAFRVFAQYREFAQAGDIEGIKSLSHQISPTCSDPDKASECKGLMSNVYNLTKDFKEKDFKHVYFDDRQLVMFTDFLAIEGEPDAEPIRNVLFFTRKEEEFKLLGIKFCLPDEEKPYNCFQTDPTKRDADQNGWWDQVESFFR